MTIRQLQTAITDSGISSTNFFNGQLLSGEDLTREQSANQKARQLLGKALGDGVAYGLDVSYKPELSGPNKTVVHVKGGLAINREGRIVEIHDDGVFLNLERDDSDETVSEEFFVPCPDFKANGATYVAGTGLYLLTMTPVEVKRGQAVVNGLRSSTLSCNQKRVIDGVQFRLIGLELTKADLADLDRLRNRVAYRAFGVEQAAYTNFFADPFGPQDTYAWLDILRGSRLYDCDIPLALVFWTAADGLVFVDNWSVRRGLSPQAPTQSPLLASPERRREIEAMLCQFQEQMAWLRERLTITAFTNLRMVDHFRYIPPAGAIPIGTDTRPRGINFLKFFEEVSYQKRVNDENIVIESARVTPILQAALHYPPVDLETSEMLWIYTVRQNLQAIDTNSLDPPQQYIIYTSGHMPFMGDPHYDINRIGYGNYF